MPRRIASGSRRPRPRRRAARVSPRSWRGSARRSPARAALHAGRDIVAVAHGGSIRAAVAHALGLAPEAALALSVDTLSLTRLDHIAGPGAGQDWRVAQLNWPAA